MPAVNDLPQGEALIPLWTSSATTHSDITITPSQSMTDFERICIEYRPASGSTTTKAFFNTADFDFNSTVKDRIFVGGHDMTNNRSYTRRLNITSATSISVSTAYRLNASGSSTAYAVIVALYGVI